VRARLPREPAGRHDVRGRGEPPSVPGRPRRVPAELALRVAARANGRLARARPGRRAAHGARAGRTLRRHPRRLGARDLGVQPPSGAGGRVRARAHVARRPAELVRAHGLRPGADRGVRGPRAARGQLAPRRPRAAARQRGAAPARPAVRARVRHPSAPPERGARGLRAAGARAPGRRERDTRDAGGPAPGRGLAVSATRPPAWTREHALLLLPASLLLALVTLLPMLRVVQLSLCRVELRHGIVVRWAGLDQFARLWRDGRWWTALRNTVVFTASSVGLELALGVGIALPLP